ncbi:hypothetical protein AB0G15_28995 [Streptosporangium sp. NPDC023825]|uniref:hypothetical protein n=1 Tax=Streptosporangium sp. NPDC023825 TaxID=3154909 RepID=UPI0034250807
MFKHALAAGTLVASTLIVGLTMAAQPAGASAAPQQVASLSALPATAGGSSFDPFNPFGFYPRYSPFGVYNTYVPFGFRPYYRPFFFHTHW